MLLNELFDKPGQYTKINSSADSVTYQFMAGDIEYELAAEILGRAHKYIYEYAKQFLSVADYEEFTTKKFMHVEFSPIDLSHKHIERAKRIQGSNDYINSYGVLGSGNALTVFNNVLQILKEVITDFRPDYFLIDAEEPSRQKLYRRMIKKAGFGHVEIVDPIKSRFSKNITFVVKVN